MCRSQPPGCNYNSPDLRGQRRNRSNRNAYHLNTKAYSKSGIRNGGSMTILSLPSEHHEILVKQAIGNCCESCGNTVPHAMLELHPIQSPDTDVGQKVRNSASDLLVLCTLCHTRLHDAVIPAELQRSAIRLRPPEVMDHINGILSGLPA